MQSSNNKQPIQSQTHKTKTQPFLTLTLTMCVPRNNTQLFFCYAIPFNSNCSNSWHRSNTVILNNFYSKSTQRQPQSQSRTVSITIKDKNSNLKAAQTTTPRVIRAMDETSHWMQKERSIKGGDCNLNQPLFSADSLRLHVRMPRKANGRAIGT